MSHSSAKMTCAQRYFLAIAILFVAWLFHVNMCEWHWKARVSVGQMSDGSWVCYPIWTRNDFVNPNRGVVTTGLTTQEGIDPNVALICGVFLPVILVVADIWWMLGWRRQRRLATGCCVLCGYDLKGSAAQCPECGTARPG